MPTGSINCNSFTQNFITLKGEAQSLAMVVEDISRPGVEGHAYREDAKRGLPFDLVGFADYVSMAAASAAYASMMSWQGKVASFTDDYGLSGANAMMLLVEKVKIIPVRNAVGGLAGGAAQAVLVMRFRMQLTK